MKIDYEKCSKAESKCHVHCMDACAVQGALSATPPVGGIIAIEPTCCTKCGKCISACPENAITKENESAMANKLGETLKAVRELRGYSLRAVEKKTNISNAYISQIENGKVKNPSLHKILKLAEFYDVPHEQLMKDAGYMIPSIKISEKTKGLTTIQTALSNIKLSLDDEKMVINFIQFLRNQRQQNEST